MAVRVIKCRWFVFCRRRCRRRRRRRRCQLSRLRSTALYVTDLYRQNGRHLLTKTVVECMFLWGG